jgi:hypothetical protein
MNIYCYIDGDDFLCEYGTDTYRLGEAHGSHLISLDPLDYIQEMYPEAGITQEVLDAVIGFTVKAGYIVESYPSESE